MMYRLEYVEKLGSFITRRGRGTRSGARCIRPCKTSTRPAAAPKSPRSSWWSGWKRIGSRRGIKDVEHEQEHKEAAVQILEHYHAAATERADTTRTFLTEKMLKWDMGPFVLTGRIDRIDEHTRTALWRSWTTNPGGWT